MLAQSAALEPDHLILSTLSAVGVPGLRKPLCTRLQPQCTTHRPPKLRQRIGSRARDSGCQRCPRIQYLIQLAAGAWRQQAAYLRRYKRRRPSAPRQDLTAATLGSMRPPAALWSSGATSAARPWRSTSFSAAQAATCAQRRACWTPCRPGPRTAPSSRSTARSRARCASRFVMVHRLGAFAGSGAARPPRKLRMPVRSSGQATLTATGPAVWLLAWVGPLTSCAEVLLPRRRPVPANTRVWRHPPRAPQARLLSRPHHTSTRRPAAGGTSSASVGPCASRGAVSALGALGRVGAIARESCTLQGRRMLLGNVGFSSLQPAPWRSRGWELVVCTCGLHPASYQASHKVWLGLV